MNQIAKYIRKCIVLCNEVTLEKGKPNIFKYLYTYYDYISAFIYHGCLIRQYRYAKFYKIKNCERKNTVTYRRICKIYKLTNNSNFINILEEKDKFNLHFKDFVNRKWISCKNMTIETLNALTQNTNNLIIKPLNGVEGGGISKIKSPKTQDEISELYHKYVNSNFLIEQCIEQNKRMKFGNEAVNTIRIHTLIDKNGEVHIIKPVLRAGIGNTVVDNYAAGGCVYDLDPLTGIIDSKSLNKKNIEYIYHPGTDICMLGYQIPLWENVIKGIKEAALLLPECRFIGWDVAITENNIELIEGNHNPDYELLEFFGKTGWYKTIKYLI